MYRKLVSRKQRKKDQQVNLDTAREMIQDQSNHSFFSFFLLAFLWISISTEPTADPVAYHPITSNWGKVCLSAAKNQNWKNEREVLDQKNVLKLIRETSRLFSILCTYIALISCTEMGYLVDLRLQGRYCLLQTSCECLQNGLIVDRVSSQPLLPGPTLDLEEHSLYSSCGDR